MHVDYIKLGKTDIQISRVTHGCMELGGSANPQVHWEVLDEEHNIQLLQTALDNGITTFDTAEGYGGGRSERIVGKALRDVRERCVIATKVAKTNLQPDDLQRALEGSLKRLDTSYIDLYYIHWPNPDIPLEKTIPAMMRLKEQGLIRAIGVSNFSIAQMQEALRHGQLDAYQPEYNLLSRGIEEELLPFCREHGISVLSYNSLAKGLLTGAFHLYGAALDPKDFRNQKPLFQKGNMERQRELIDVLKQVADAHGATVSQVAVRWTLEQLGMTSTIIGTQNPKHFMDNIRAMDITLSADELSRIDEASRRVISELEL